MKKRYFSIVACAIWLTGSCTSHLGTQRIFIDHYEDMASAVASWKKQDEYRAETDPRWLDLSGNDVGDIYEYSISGIDECANEGRVKDNDHHPAECLYLHDRVAWGCIVSKTSPSAYAAVRYFPNAEKELSSRRSYALDFSSHDDYEAIMSAHNFFPYYELPFSVEKEDGNTFYQVKSGDVVVCMVQFTSNSESNFVDGFLNYLLTAPAQ